MLMPVLPCASRMSTRKTERPPVRLLACSRGVVRASSRQEIGILGARGPDLLAVDDVVVAFAHRGRAQVEGVRARCRLGDAEGLQPQLAGRDLRQPARLLRRAAVPQHRAHRVHLGVTGRAIATRRLDLLHDGGRRRHGQAAAAVFLRDQRGQEPGVGERADELGRVGALAVERAPIFTGEPGAERANGFADLRKLVG